MGALSSLITGVKTGQSPLPSTSGRNRLFQTREIKPAIRPKVVTVGELLKSIQPGALPSLLLGECADGLPFLIELGDPRMGAILVSCDHGRGKTHHLQVMAESAAKMNPPSEFQLGVITFKPGEWRSWERTTQSKKYLQGIYAWYDPYVESFIQNMVDLAEARQDGQQSGAHVLFILDDLNFIEELSFEAQVNLHWLIEYGSQAGIWVVGAINAHKAAQFRYWVDPFRTRIIGKVESEKNADILALRTGSAADGIDPGIFRAWTGYGWRTYRLPLLGG
jgi:hypothetical protein